MIIFPMAGLSSRFRVVGYDVPKFQLPIWDGYVFDYAVSSFRDRFRSDTFVFIYRELGGIQEFLHQRVAVLGIKEAIFVALESETSGQAETVEFGLDIIELGDDAPLTIFNIDTFRRPGIPTGLRRSDLSGFLEVFEGQGENWSFALPDSGDADLVAKTAEKVAISNLCSNGLYHFASAKIFKDALQRERITAGAAELYIAPIYNHVIKEGYLVGLTKISSQDVRFCGVPSEYEFLRNQPAPWEMARQGQL